MYIAIRLIAFAAIFLLLLPSSNAYQSTDIAEINVLIVPFISHLLGIMGSVYLAAQLYTIAQRASSTWKYLSFSIIIFSIWNIMMALNIVLKVIYNGNISLIEGSFNTIYFIKAIDPLLEAIALVLFYYGLRKVSDAMHSRPWAVFSKEDHDD